MTTDQNRPECIPTFRQPRARRSGSDSSVCGWKGSFPARARCPRRLVRVHLAHRGGYPPALGESAAPPRGEARRLRRLSRDGLRSRSGRGARAEARRPRARGPARRDRGSRARRCASSSPKRSPPATAARCSAHASRLRRLAQERDAFADAATLLEAALDGEPFVRVDRFDIYANLGRAYAGAGRRERAVELFERCLDALSSDGDDRRLEARYATLLSYALSDIGELARAEEVVAPRARARRRTRATRTCVFASTGRWRGSRMPKDASRRAHERAQGDRAPAGDRRHLPPRARAHPRGRHHARTRRRGRRRAAPRPGRALPRHVGRRSRTRSRSRCSAPASRRFAARPRRRARARPRGTRARRDAHRPTRGSRSPRSADGLSLAGDIDAADTAYGRGGRPAREQGRWRDAATACRAWGRMLRDIGRETRGDRRARSRGRARHARDARRPRTPSVDASSSRSRRAGRTRSRSRRGSRATRRARSATASSRPSLAVDGPPELARAWQSPDGTVTIRARVGGRRASGCAGSSRSTTTTPSFLRARSRRPDARPRVARSCAACGPLRVATVAQALLRAFCGQLIEAKRARAARADDHPHALRRGPERLHVAPTTRDLAALAPSQLRALGLHARRGAVARPPLPHDRARAAARRRDRARSRRGSSASAASGPGRSASSASRASAATTTGSSATSGSSSCLRALRGRPVEGWETAELLEPYGEWAGLASVYLLAGYSRGLVP